MKRHATKIPFRLLTFTPEGNQVGNLKLPPFKFTSYFVFENISVGSSINLKITSRNVLYKIDTALEASSIYVFFTQL